MALEEANRLAGKTPEELKLEAIEAQEAALDQLRLEQEKRMLEQQQRMLEQQRILKQQLMLEYDELDGLPPMDPPPGVQMKKDLADFISIQMK